ncbi:MAG: beta-galactosidase [Candidatus Latescibacteria bacterium]|nr:beta-galactosidase [Candidatus Latescibacterota bacterium]
MEKRKIFYYGGTCFRPPNPPRSQHRSHLEMIKKELGFNVVRVWCLWNHCHRAPEVFDFSEHEEIISICDELELSVIFQTVLEDAPYWLEQAHPECRYVDSKGKPDELSGNDNHPSGGHPGLCLDNPVVVKQAERFLKAVAESMKAHTSLLAYDCWNEPHIEPCWNTNYWADMGDLLYCYCPGSMIAENSFGLFDHNGMLQPQVPPYGLSEVFGLEEEENYFTWPDYESTAKHPLTTVGPSFFERFVGPYNEEIYSGPEITLSEPVKTRLRAYGFLTPLRLTTAKSLGGWKDYCLAAHNKFGKGEAYYFGTFLGLSMFNLNEGAGKVIANILSQRIKPKVKGKDLRPRLIDAGKEALLCVFNNSRFESYTESIVVPGKFSQAFDIHTEKEMAVKDGAVKVTVDREDVVVLHLRQEKS